MAISNLLVPYLVSYLTLSNANANAAESSNPDELWWAEIDSSNVTYKGACGFNSDTQQFFALATNAYAVYDVSLQSTEIFELDQTLATIGGPAQSARQFGQYIYFLSSHKPGRFDMDSATLQYPLRTGSDVNFTANGPRPCLAVSDDDKFVFVTGGALTADGRTGKMRRFEIYDVHNDKRIDGPDVPLSRALANHACAVANGKLFVFGGDASDQVFSIDVSNPSSLSSGTDWVSISSRLQKGRNGVRAVPLDGFIYVIGGGGSPLLVDRFDPQTNAITTATSAPFSTDSLKTPCVGVDEDGHAAYAKFGRNGEGVLVTMSTREPTLQPTTKPSAAPTTRPSVDPTSAPTANPSSNPTGAPTANPSSDPTAAPSANPSSDPTRAPSANPSSDPTSAPTANPSTDPTRDPTRVPSEKPTANPSEKPTANPSEKPTANPSTDPTANPSTDPTANPSTDPTDGPTEMPSTEPTTEPTLLPTTSPTLDGCDLDIDAYLSECYCESTMARLNLDSAQSNHEQQQETSLITESLTGSTSESDWQWELVLILLTVVVAQNALLIVLGCYSLRAKHSQRAMKGAHFGGNSMEMSTVVQSTATPSE